jgi:hypothetical protein
MLATFSKVFPFWYQGDHLLKCYECFSTWDLHQSLNRHFIDTNAYVLHDRLISPLQTIISACFSSPKSDITLFFHYMYWCSLSCFLQYSFTGKIIRGKFWTIWKSWKVWWFQETAGMIVWDTVQNTVPIQSFAVLPNK